jgi:cation transport regulator ChaC
LLLFFFAFFLVAMDLFSLSILHGILQRSLLQLFECIESAQSEVKRKMIVRACAQRCTKVTSRIAREKNRGSRLQLARNVCSFGFVFRARKLFFELRLTMLAARETIATRVARNLSMGAIYNEKRFLQARNHAKERMYGWF